MTLERCKDGRWRFRGLVPQALAASRYTDRYLAIQAAERLGWCCYANGACGEPYPPPREADLVRAK